MSTNKAFSGENYKRSGEYVGNYNGGRSEVQEMVSTIKRRGVRAMAGNSSFIGKRVLLIHNADLEKAHKALKEFYPKHYATETVSNLMRDVASDKKMGVFENNEITMVNIKTFESFDSSINEGKKPTADDLYKLFVRINKDNEADKETGLVVPLNDVEYYTEQINNIYFNNATGRDNFTQSKKWAESLAKVSDLVDKFGQKMNGSSKGTAAGWVDGVKELNPEEKKAVWNGIQQFIDKNTKDATKLPKWVNESVNEADQSKIRLTEDDFRKLVSGEVITPEDFPPHLGKLQIMLADIGWDNMVSIISDEMHKAKGGRTYGNRIDRS